MNDPPESHSIELLNPIPEMFIFRGSELEFLLLALVSTAPTAVEVLCDPLVLESFEYQPMICDELQVAPSTLIFCSAGEIVATGHAAKPLEQRIAQQMLLFILHFSDLCACTSAKQCRLAQELFFVRKRI
jgi:hypothetical protein